MADTVSDLQLRAKQHSLKLTLGHYMLCVQFENGQKPFIWDFKNNLPDADFPIQRTIGGVLFNKCLVSDDEYWCSYPNKEQEGILVVSSHLYRLFPGPLFIELNPEAVDLAKMFSYPHLRRCKALQMTGSYRMPISLLWQVFNNITIEKDLIVRAMTSSRFPIVQALHVDNLFLQYAGWMNRDHLLALDCRIVHIEDHYFSCEDLELFAKNWKASSSRKLEHIQLGWEDKEPFELSGLNSEPWDPKKREKLFFAETLGDRRRVDASEGYDFEREDGLLGTFVFETDPYMMVHFFVWHERFPEKKRIAQLPAQLAPFYRELETLNRQYPDSSSLERMLANPRLRIDEFLDTYAVLKNFYLENRSESVGRSERRVCFEKMVNIIDIQTTRAN